MGVDIRAVLRQLLIWTGGHLSRDRLYDATNVLGALALGHWVAHHPSQTKLRVHRDKTDTYRDAIALLTTPNPLYLEFGVWEKRRG